MPFVTAAMTQEFAAHTMRRKSCGFWAIRITLFGEAGNLWRWLAN